MRNSSLNAVYELAKKHSEVIFIGSDLGPTTLSKMKTEFPDRFFMEGISEQHIIGMSAGLAMNGFIPYVNTIASFITRRCFENIAVDLCMHNLPVRLIGNGAGGVYAPLGPTHQAIEDIAIMRSLPNMTVLCPCDAVEASALIYETIKWPSPVYIRLGKGGDRIITKNQSDVKIGKASLKRQPKDVLFLTTGVMAQNALDASGVLMEANLGCGVLHFSSIKPLDHDSLQRWIPKVPIIITVEEHLRAGGLGSTILEFCNDYMPDQVSKIYRIGIQDKFSDEYGSQKTLWEHWEIDHITISKKVKKILKIS